MATKANAVGKALQATASKRIRKLFGNIHEAVEMPNLIEVQRDSYEQFLRSDPATGYVSGLEKTLRSVSRSAISLERPNWTSFIMN
jgi:DNA-directed RNA polymerase subunit beta